MSIAVYAADFVSPVPRGSTKSSVAWNFCSVLAQNKPCFTELPHQSAMRGALVANCFEEQLLIQTEELKILKRADRVARLGHLAAQMALDSFCERTKVDPHRSTCAVVAGSSRGPTESIERFYSEFLNNQRIPPYTSPITTFGSLASTIAQANKLSGPTFSISSTCTSGLAAVEQVTLQIHAKQAEIGIAIGAEAPLTPFTAAQMQSLGIAASNWSDPYPCKPLSLQHEPGEGMVLGEGAGALVLADESASFSVKPIAVIRAVRSANEPLNSLTGISDEGLVLQRSMQLALDSAGNPKIDLILAHAPGTQNGDSAEINAINSVFGDQRPAVYSPKWYLGHSFGASGVLALGLAIELLHGGNLAPLPYPSAENLLFPLEGSQMNHILINSTGFGGVGTSAIVSRPDS